MVDLSLGDRQRIVSLLDDMEDEALRNAQMYRALADEYALGANPSLLDDLEAMQERFVQVVQ